MYFSSLREKRKVHISCHGRIDFKQRFVLQLSYFVPIYKLVRFDACILGEID